MHQLPSDIAPLANRDRVYVVGDIHGHLERLLKLLVDGGLLSAAGDWTGGDAALWFTGDFADRGPLGIEAIDLVMRLQRQAAAAGGRVDAVLGNHDVLLLGACHFPELFREDHERNGGYLADLLRLRLDQEDWLRQRPAMARIADALLIHADSTGYLAYGRTVVDVNRTVSAILAEPDGRAWGLLLDRLSERFAFSSGEPTAIARLARFLATFDARRLVHGHTPIPYLTEVDPAGVRAPLVYAEGRCVNVDAGLYMGAPGFLFRVDAPAIA